jgi:hypothetical protein
LGLDRSELVGEALRWYLVRLQSEADAGVLKEISPTGSERALGEVAD